jgi:hypothetical protein
MYNVFTNTGWAKKKYHISKVYSTKRVKDTKNLIVTQERIHKIVLSSCSKNDISKVVAIISDKLLETISECSPMMATTLEISFLEHDDKTILCILSCVTIKFLVSFAVFVE